MKVSEYYEQFCKVDNGKGEMVPMPKLNEGQKAMLDQWAANENIQWMCVIRKRRRPIHINLDWLRSVMEQYLKNKQQQP